MVETEISSKSDLGGSLFHTSETKLKQLIREFLALQNHAANVSSVFLHLAVIILNLAQTSLSFESPIFVGGFDYRKDSPQALLWEALDSLRHHSCEKVVNSVVTMTDTSYHLGQDREQLQLSVYDPEYCDKSNHEGGSLRKPEGDLRCIFSADCVSHPDSSVSAHGYVAGNP